MPFNHRAHACRDRMCGAEDCPTCRPDNFDEEGRYLGDRKCVVCGDGFARATAAGGDPVCEGCLKADEELVETGFDPGPCCKCGDWVDDDYSFNHNKPKSGTLCTACHVQSFADET